MSKTLKEVGVLSYGKSPNEVSVKNSEFAVLGTGGVMGFASKPLFKAPFVLVGRKGTIDKPLYVDKDSWIIDTAYALHPLSNNSAKFLYYFLHTINLVKYNEASGVPSLNRENLYKITVPDFSPKIQNKIAHILEVADTCISQTEETISKLQKIKMGLMQDLFTRGVDEKGKLRQSYQEQPELYKPSPLGMIPKEWDVKTIGELASKVGSGVTPSGGSEVYVKSGVLFIRSQNIYDNEFKFDDLIFIDHQTNKLMKRSQLEEWDILYNITGASIGRTCVFKNINIPSNVNQHVCIIRLKEKSEFGADYVSSYLASIYGKKQLNVHITIGNRESLNYQQIKNFLIPMPPMNEVKKFIEVFNSHTSSIQMEKSNLAKYVELKSGLMQDLLTGNVEVKVDNNE